MNEQELQRQAKHRLAILRHADEATGNVARTCRHDGISRTRFYKSRRRYDDEGLSGLRDRSTRPHNSPTVETDIPVFFADPQAPWQRGTNENTNGLLRQYSPKGTDLSVWSTEDIEAVAHTLNTRPRKILGWKSPAEAFDEHLRSLQQAGAAKTG